MADLIDRQAAIEAFYKHPNIDWTTLDVLAEIKALPSAQPERKEGLWVEEDDAIIHGHCSNCGWPSVWQETDVFGMKFCPNCGAKMGGNDNANV